MPLYEYKCHSCGKTFEVIQKFSDAPLTTHAECGSGPVEKLISAPSFQFKGTGWYVTDYGKGNGKQAKPETGSDTKSESKSESKSDSKSESKIETKTESKTSSSSSTDTKPAS